MNEWLAVLAHNFWIADAYLLAIAVGIWREETISQFLADSGHYGDSADGDYDPTA